MENSGMQRIDKTGEWCSDKVIEEGVVPFIKFYNVERGPY